MGGWVVRRSDGKVAVLAIWGWVVECRIVGDLFVGRRGVRPADDWWAVGVIMIKGSELYGSILVVFTGSTAVVDGSVES